MTAPRDVGRLVRTVAHLPPMQVVHRVRLRAKRVAYARRPAGRSEGWSHGVPITGRWPAGFDPIDRAVAHGAPAGGTIEAVGERHDVLRDGWRPADRTQLFRYHVHYFEWAWPLAAASDRHAFARMWRSWRAGTELGRWDEWSPYVVALRAWVLCGTFDDLAAGSDIADDVLQHQRSALGYLQRNLELDVGGNHLVKDLKAIIGLAVFFDLPGRRDRAIDRLLRQARSQVLPDGGHFEMSPGYHAQVMADLADVASLLEWSAPDRRDATAELTRIVRRMADWLAAMSFPDGTLPMLGDSTTPPDGLLTELRRRYPPQMPRPVEVLADTGYVALRPSERVMAVFDFGRPCPAELPAHAQADWGTFELWVRPARTHAGRRVVVDPGVSTYVGPRRAVERSTAAHNTVAVGGHDSTEVWSSFRAGRLARPRRLDVDSLGDGVRIDAEVEGFVGGARHRRIVELSAHRIEVHDEVAPPLAASSGLTVSRESDARHIGTSGAALTSEPTSVAETFGVTAPALRLTQHLAHGRGSWTIDLDGLVAS